MEIYLLTDAAVPTTQAWQDAIDALGFDVRFVDQQPLQATEIRLRVACQGKPVLFEIERVSLARVRKMFPDVAFRTACPACMPCIGARPWKADSRPIRRPQPISLWSRG